MRYHLIMPGRGIPLVTGGFYHVFNRGVAKLPTFISQQDYYQAILGLNYYRFVKPPIKLSRFKKLSYKSKVQLLETLSVGENKFLYLLLKSKDWTVVTTISAFLQSSRFSL